MKTNRPAQLAAITLAVMLPWSGTAKSQNEYKAKGGTRVVILPIGKLVGHQDAESKIEFYSPKNEMLCAVDYSSEDGEHGYGVVKAAWTPDQKYFVFSLTSSGGHQAWHAPTLFYVLRDNSIHSLDGYVDAGISKGAFTLKDPNIVLTEVWRAEQPTPVKFRLDSLSKQKSRNALRCADRKTIKAEPYSLRPDA